MTQRAAPHTHAAVCYSVIQAALSSLAVSCELEVILTWACFEACFPTHTPGAVEERGISRPVQARVVPASAFTYLPASLAVSSYKNGLMCSLPCTVSLVMDGRAVRFGGPRTGAGVTQGPQDMPLAQASSLILRK